MVHLGYALTPSSVLQLDIFHEVFSLMFYICFLLPPSRSINVITAQSDLQYMNHKVPHFVMSEITCLNHISYIQIQYFQ
jgi:hypothetical protein